MKKNNSNDVQTAIEQQQHTHAHTHKSMKYIMLHIGIEAKKMFHFFFVLSWEKIRWGQKL